MNLVQQVRFPKL